ncbi:hypothetical protein [Micromonospora chersina]|uniref:hypothetical protein n=1 Tax=Micromonospora chersina TaxID=47854 RepID=UPI00371F1DAC
MAGLPSERHKPLLDQSIDGRFDTFVTPSNLLIQDVAERFGAASARSDGNDKAPARNHVLSWGLTPERVTGIEPALSAWESR